MSTNTSPAPLNREAPMKGKKLHLHGFDAIQAQELREELEELGLNLVSLRISADLLVVPDGTTQPAGDGLRTKQVELSQLRRLLKPVQVTAPLREVESRAVVEKIDGSVRILDVILDGRSHPGSHTPSAERFARVCLDTTFLEAARAVAKAVQFRTPCVLEGETAAAKTTAVLWVAHLLNQEVVRVNLNGQTDTGELVGRFVPDDRPDSRSGWRFQEGIIPKAMRNGWWVILDEMNLAEPQVLERLNPVLEDPAGLVLTEGPGTVFGPNGEVEIHNDFQLFATLNPAEYSGRSTLSPAFRDRWTSWNWVNLPDEASLLQTLEYWAFGKHPEVAVAGQVWCGKATDAVLHGLADDPSSHELLANVARFHASIANASQPQGSLGRNRREPFVFTRRTLWTAMVQANQQMLESQGALSSHLSESLLRVYGQRLRESGEREALFQALKATGLK